MALSILGLKITANGIEDDNFDGVTIGSVVKSKPIMLMNKTNHAILQERYTFTVNRIEPVEKSLIDLNNLRNATFEMDFGGGKKHIYMGVYTSETGEGSLDQETEWTHPVSCSAENMVPEGF